MKTIITTIAIAFFLVLNINITFAGNSGGEDKGKIATTPTITENTANKNKALKGVMVLDKAPILDKEICGLELNFDIIIEGNSVEIFDKSVGSFSNVEVMYGDGTNSNNFDDKHTYEKEGVKYIAVSIYDQNTGCMDFVGANVFIGKKAEGKQGTVIINTKDLKADEVANM